tara:strand:- start:795 stop:1103 length:309 start_codon:yes stop_codon:yes gene_type:complete
MGSYYLPPSGSQIKQFSKLGIPGEFHSAKIWSGGQLDLTGSNYGYGGLLISGSTINGNISVAGGATIAIANFDEKRLLSIGVAQVSGSTSPGGEVYLFKRQQ